ncbi:hypothetical protein EON80_30790 [bacterium]|nr:MAG: hypothetical protein EON80_30790 [bacterium]
MTFLGYDQPCGVPIALIAGATIGLGSYGACRWMERNALNVFRTLQCLAAVALVRWMVTTAKETGENPFLYLLFCFGSTSILALPGGWMHRRSGGASVSQWWAFITANCSTVLSAFLGFWIDRLADPPEGFIGPFMPEMIFLLAVIFFPTLAPLAILIWKRNQVTPGIGEAFEETSGRANYA